MNRTCRGSYVQGHFVKVTDPIGEIISRNPGDLDQPEISYPFSYEHVHDAVSAAKRGFSSWRRMTPADRANVLTRYHDMLKSRADDLAQLVSFEMGKAMWEAKQEVAETLTLIDFFLKEGSQTAKTLKIPGAAEEADGTVRFLSRGVCAVITPASQPVFQPHVHIIPALVHGNTVVFKSTKHAPGVGQFMAEAFHDSGMPAGVVNMFHGDAEASRRLVAHTEVDVVFFTGPYETGFKIKKQILSDYWKSVVMDMGGRNAAVIWDDCNYDKALHETLLAAFLTTGQRCQTTSRVIVHEKIFDKFMTDLHGLAKKLTVGYGMDEKQSFMGPLVSEAAMENYLRYQGIATREGCEEIMRGKTLDREKKGYYVSPSIHWVKTPEPKSVYQKNEIHGPNIALFKAKDIDEAAEIINGPQHGLVASIYTGARENYARLAEEARVGMLHWNRMTIEPAYRLPTAGIKRSGNFHPMGSFSGYQCTHPLSSLEHTGGFDRAKLPAALPKQ